MSTFKHSSFVDYCSNNSLIWTQNITKYSKRSLKMLTIAFLVQVFCFAWLKNISLISPLLLIKMISYPYSWKCLITHWKFRPTLILMPLVNTLSPHHALVESLAAAPKTWLGDRQTMTLSSFLLPLEQTSSNFTLSNYKVLDIPNDNVDSCGG